MLKRIFAIMLLCSLVTAQANVVNTGSLKTIFNELNFALTVEWDQKDKKFYKAQMKKFQSEITNLQKTGLSNAELIQFAKSQLKNEKVAADLEVALNLVQVSKLDAKESRKLVLDTIGKSHTTGASWAGDAATVAAATLLVILVVAIAISVPSTGGGNNGGGNNGGYCYDEEICYDYYDYWGYYWYTDCYWQTYCY
ncbi:MAG: hypothetical protein ACI9QD_001047 [Thermoproteota archaeon]|jgi:hypothetical protein